MPGLSSCDNDDGVNYEMMKPDIALLGKWVQIAAGDDDYSMKESGGGYTMLFSDQKLSNGQKEFEIISTWPSVNLTYRIDSDKLYIDYYDQEQDTTINEKIWKYTFIKDKLRLEVIYGDLPYAMENSTIRIYKKISDDPSKPAQYP